MTVITKKTAATILIGSVAVAIVIGMVLKPVLLNVYFTNQQILSFNESVSQTQDDRGRFTVGKVVVIQGYLEHQTPQGFVISNRFSDEQHKIPDQILEVRTTEKLNCIPQKQKLYKVAGAYNLAPSKQGDIGFIYSIDLNKNVSGAQSFILEFDGVWVIGGCS